MTVDVRRSTAELMELASRAGAELEGAPAEEIIGWAAETFGPRFCVTSSMADAVLAHVAARVVPGVEVVFLDTGLHFPETLRVRDQVARTIPVTVVTVQPEISVAEQDERFGPRLYSRDPDSCCYLRKVKPLEDALAGYDAWAAGLRRDESPTRANTPVVHFEQARGKVKVNPLAAWTQAEVDQYIARYDIPVNQLLNQGYGSVGCWPCTRRIQPGEDARAGRWAMFDKTECGLHAA
ncbi:phosphoadenylyl-sulfate reductase [Catellatospora chokoriensis]|uniref:Adenosine 5'-phosphosulfate reductase n=1 Tax=Catellatospora chokoriensis TaxID=310353 RepID=A0A8J3JLL8_9ACTN|nr:phosphoadenylyl-sulfate reductase [Catellatospora chokoriensis]GIF87122.1 phosphoadenosine phosphosulfate reductase [Catellatospora chokoriensis]